MFAVVIAAAMAVTPPSDPCRYDRKRLLALDETAFDEDFTGGWRALAANPRCIVAAADLVRDYRKARAPSSSILFWHEGQLRADAGQTARAIRLFERSHRARDFAGWNYYVDGTIAFLRHDRRALEIARNALAAVPLPADAHSSVENGRLLIDLKTPGGQTLRTAWPLNLNFLDGFLACFDRPYAEAYGPECSRPIRSTES